MTAQKEGVSIFPVKRPTPFISTSSSGYPKDMEKMVHYSGVKRGLSRANEVDCQAWRRSWTTCLTPLHLTLAPFPVCVHHLLTSTLLQGFHRHVPRHKFETGYRGVQGSTPEGQVWG